MQLIDKADIYLKENLDVLFIALNPPVQSNSNGHYFSGSQSTFFKQLYLSGLITEDIDKAIADELVFGGNKYNYKNKNYGVIDLLSYVEETNSGNVMVKNTDILSLIEKIKKYKPKNVCIIHSRVMKSLPKIIKRNFQYGYNGKLFDDIETELYCNYFPNGNPISTETKLSIYAELKDKL